MDGRQVDPAPKYEAPAVEGEQGNAACHRASSPVVMPWSSTCGSLRVQGWECYTEDVAGGRKVSFGKVSEHFLLAYATAISAKQLQQKCSNGVERRIVV